MQHSAGRLFGIAVMIVLAVSGIAYSRYSYGMIFPVDGGFINQIGDIAGGDFLVFYNAAVMTLKGQAGSVWDRPVFDASLYQIYSQEITKLRFFNPPVALLLWTPFGLLSHVHALWLWTALPLMALGWCVYRLTSHWPATVLTSISPLTAHTAGSGQTGILFAAAMAAFLLIYQRYPARAGGIATLFVIKPHLAFAIPLCLLVDRNWRALIAMTLCTVALSAAVTLIFGFEIWISFLDGVRHHSGIVFSAANANFDRMPSILYLMLRLGAGDSLAWGLQIAVSLATAAMLATIWRLADDPMHRAFAVALAVCLLTPKVMHYDMVVLLIPVAMLIARLEHGTADISFVLLALAIWCLPYLEPTFKAWGFHPGGLLLFAGMILTFCKAVPFGKQQRAGASADRRHEVSV